MRLVPAIDLRGGRCVRLYQGDYQRQTTYEADPVELAAAYAAAGAGWIHLVDLDGAREGDFRNLEAIGRVAAAVPAGIQCGGGIRAREDLQRLLDAGVDRAVIGSLAVRDPDRVARWLSDFGPGRICLALDVRPDGEGGFRLATSGWTETAGLTVEAGLQAYAGTGLIHVLCTDISRDGTLEGPNVELYRRLAAIDGRLSVQASGGVADLDSLRALKATGAEAVIVGRALLEGRFTVEQAIACLREG